MYPTHACPIGCFMLVLWPHKYKVGHIDLILIRHHISLIHLKNLNFPMCNMYLDLIPCKLFATCPFLVWDMCKSLSINSIWYLDNLKRNGTVRAHICTTTMHIELYVCMFYCLLLWNCKCLFKLWTLLFAAWTFVNELWWIYAKYVTSKSSSFVFSTVKEPVSSAIRVFQTPF